MIRDAERQQGTLERLHAYRITPQENPLAVVALDTADAFHAFYRETLRETCTLIGVIRKLHAMVDPSHKAEADLLMVWLQDQVDARWADQHGGRLPGD